MVSEWVVVDEGETATCLVKLALILRTLSCVMVIDVIYDDECSGWVSARAGAGQHNLSGKRKP